MLIPGTFKCSGCGLEYNKFWQADQCCKKGHTTRYICPICRKVHNDVYDAATCCEKNQTPIGSIIPEPEDTTEEDPCVCQHITDLHCEICGILIEGSPIRYEDYDVLCEDCYDKLHRSYMWELNRQYEKDSF